jgi:hypothetical protein
MINFVKHCGRFAGQELGHTLHAFPLGQQIQLLILSSCHKGKTDQILVVYKAAAIFSAATFIHVSFSTL